MNTLIQLKILLTSLALAQADKPQIPHIAPDAPSSEYRRALGGKLLQAANDGLDSIVQLGERNLAWLNHINAHRPADDKLSLTSKETQNGIPIHKPSQYNPELIQKKLTDLKPKIPEEIQKVLFQNQPFTDAPPVSVEDYLNASREMDRVYQSALRWRMMSPWLGWLEERRHHDLRGWYFLSHLENRAEKLRTYSSLDANLKEEIRSWLANMCFNSDSSNSVSSCFSNVDRMISQNRDLETYYQSLAPRSERIFATYFTIPDGAARSEIRFERGEQSRTVAPFLDPGRNDVRSFLQENIQDEWRSGSWHLELPFANSAGIPKVEFLPGVTPHVNGLGGDTITMNSTQPLTEYDAKWTIRHEYGHVLGFPDCYVEFYERERNVIVNYQFDIDNLMCSRRGHIQEKHVLELERAYSKL